MTLHLGHHESKVRSALARLKREDFVRRFLSGDPTLWKQGEHHAAIIRNRMGWLHTAAWMRPRLPELADLADGLRRDRVRDVVLLGMGGSSLAADVMRRTFRRRAGHPAIHVLDTTDPESIAATERAIVLARTLFLVASKSGTTTESAMLARYFESKAPPSHFMAITDPGTPLEKEARAKGYRAVFLNPPDIGGRYSALSYFGMVPAAILGLDVARLLARGQQAADMLSPDLSPQDCPHVVLGAALGSLGMARRDKVTFVLSPAMASFGYWVEQLIAESTGKEGRGLVPVEGEPLATPARYGKDRFFVRLKLRGSSEPLIDRRLRDIRAAGHPEIALEMEDLHDLGAQFMLWEIATATAGAVMGVNPFDEPNVAESKENTRQMLDHYKRTGSLPSAPPNVEEGGVRAWAVPTPWKRSAAGGLAPLLAEVLRSVRPGDYVGLMAYLPSSERGLESRLQALRAAVRDATGAATTLGYGPRFLHSTGQLHKGGPASGVFIQLTADKKVDLPVPDETFTFGVLQAAQAAGDFASLASRGLRAVRLHLGPSAIKGLDALLARLGARAKG